MNDISEMIKNRRKSLSLSQDELAKISLVSRPTIVKMESGDIEKMQVSTLFSVLNALKIGIQYIDISNEAS